MLNVDGVVCGNYRTGVAGRDMNRQFRGQNKLLFPEVNALRDLVSESIKDNGENILAYFDLHGHSNQKNVFIYGPEFKDEQRAFYQARFLPIILEKNAEMFKYLSCSFRISETRKNTARAVFFNEFNVKNVYTMESSFGNYCNNKNQMEFFSKDKFLEMGKALGVSIAEYVKILDNFEKQKEELTKQLILQNQQNCQNESPKIRKKKNKKNKKEKKLKYQNDQQLSPKLIECDKIDEDQLFTHYFQDFLQKIKQYDQQRLSNKIESSYESDSDDSDEDLPKAKLKFLEKKIKSHMKLFSNALQSAPDKIEKLCTVKQQQQSNKKQKLANIQKVQKATEMLQYKLKNKCEKDHHSQITTNLVSSKVKKNFSTPKPQSRVFFNPSATLLKLPTNQKVLPWEPQFVKPCDIIPPEDNRDMKIIGSNAILNKNNFMSFRHKYENLNYVNLVEFCMPSAGQPQSLKNNKIQLKHYPSLQERKFYKSEQKPVKNYNQIKDLLTPPTPTPNQQQQYSSFPMRIAQLNSPASQPNAIIASIQKYNDINNEQTSGIISYSQNWNEYKGYKAQSPNLKQSEKINQRMASIQNNIKGSPAKSATKFPYVDKQFQQLQNL